MATNNDQTQLVGNFKDVWGNNVIELFKFQAPILNAIPFESAELVGGKFHQPADLQQEHGFTCAATGSTPTLITPVAGFMGDVQVEGSQLFGRSRVTYEAIMRSQNDRQAVKQATKHVVRRLGLSGTKRLEIQALHGRRGLAAVKTGFSGTTTLTIPITDASWSSGIWAGMENCLLDFYDSTGATKRNLASSAQVTCTVTAVNTATKTLTVTASTSEASWDSRLAATDLIFFQSASISTEMAGIDLIGRNTSTLFNVNPALYSLWAGNLYSSSTGTLSMAKILDALSIAASYGLQGMRAVCVVSPKAFEVLNSDQAALRKYDASYRPAKAESGAEGLVYHSQTGELEIMSHAFQKDGLAHIFVPEEMRRIGAADLEFVIRGGSQPQLILESADAPTSEMRTQSHQAIYSEVPRHMVVLDGITY